MLANALVCADVPPNDLQRARHFYEQTLGLTVARSDEEGGVYYKAGGGTMLNLYERPHSAAEPTVIFLAYQHWRFSNIDLAMRPAASE